MNRFAQPNPLGGNATKKSEEKKKRRNQPSVGSKSAWGMVEMILTMNFERLVNVTLR
jgi:hypothetical protein